ncbi:hypothetical protein Anas_09650 [Armadillidium nasatum]|uniref:Uncharacterized protein n=1 Tax=Armadillidium nasatum TaxID=96803 RepID=A0A5N5SRM2_9CRUS|nr:hypothetical protein Anas_09650 [Armadillidium nasatum]
MTDLTPVKQETITPEISKSSPKSFRNSPLEVKIKDSSYGWVVVFSMFMSNIMTVGYVKAFGVIYNAILDVYPDATGTMAGLMVGLLAGFRSYSWNDYESHWS